MSSERERPDPSSRGTVKHDATYDGYPDVAVAPPRYRLAWIDTDEATFDGEWVDTDGLSGPEWLPGARRNPKRAAWAIERVGQAYERLVSAAEGEPS